MVVVVVVVVSVAGGSWILGGAHSLARWVVLAGCCDLIFAAAVVCMSGET